MDENKLVSKEIDYVRFQIFIAMAPVGSTSHTSVKACSKSHQNRLMNERQLEKLLRTVVDTSVSSETTWFSVSFLGHCLARLRPHRHGRTKLPRCTAGKARVDNPRGNDSNKFPVFVSPPSVRSS